MECDETRCRAICFKQAGIVSGRAARIEREPSGCFPERGAVGCILEGVSFVPTKSEKRQRALRVSRKVFPSCQQRARNVREHCGCIPACVSFVPTKSKKSQRTLRVCPGRCILRANKERETAERSLRVYPGRLSFLTAKKKLRNGRKHCGCTPACVSFVPTKSEKCQRALRVYPGRCIFRAKRGRETAESIAGVSRKVCPSCQQRARNGRDDIRLQVWPKCI